MRKCPKCGKELQYLHSVESDAEIVYEFSPDGDYDMKDVLHSKYEWIPVYKCPECNEILFRNEDEALRFLQGGD